MRRQAGFTIIELLIVIAIIGVISALAVPGMVRARRAARESAAIGSMRTILSAQSAYLPTYGGYSRYGDSDDLKNNKFIDSEVFNGVTNGYSFTLELGNGGTTFEATATPDPADAESKYFWTSEQAVIRFKVGATADATSDRIPDFH